MATEVNVGVNNVARKIGDIYVGVNGVARKVTAGYIGVNGVARLFYSPNLFLADGLTKSNVIAAYDFYRAGSQAGALQNQANSNYPLTMVGLVSYSQGNGFVIPDTDSASTGGRWSHGLTSAITTFNSVIVKFKDASTENTNPGYTGSCLLPMSLTRYIQLWGQTWTSQNQLDNPIMVYGSPDSDGNRASFIFSSVGKAASGVLGISNFGASAALYWNGQATARTSANIRVSNGNMVGRTLGQGALSDQSYVLRGKTYMAAAFYNVALTAAQMLQIYQQM